MKKKKPALSYTGVAQYTSYFDDKVTKEEEKEISESKFRNPEYGPQCRVDIETKAEKKQRLRKMKIDQNAAKIKLAMQNWDPTKDEKIQVLYQIFWPLGINFASRVTPSSRCLSPE